jgi:hypothetical protein
VASLENPADMEKALSSYLKVFHEQGNKNL